MSESARKAAADASESAAAQAAPKNEQLTLVEKSLRKRLGARVQQLDKMWEEEQKELKHQEALVALGEAEAAKKTDPADHLPFACLICREPWHAGSHPVQTKCEHYFCERCAIEHFQKSRRCFACSEQTGGVFNKAKAIQEKIDRLKAAEEVASAEDMTQEQLNAEYEASKESSKRRGYTGGWGYVG